jgi:hypothetical protein
MSDDLSPGIGTILSVVAAVPATNDDAGFGALTLVPVGEITEVPEYGPTSEVVTHVPLATGITAKYHGAINMGSITVPLAIDRADAGQVILRAAEVSRDRISFGITYPDGTIEYFQGKVFSFTIGASAGAVVSGNCNIEIETRPVIVAP